MYALIAYKDARGRHPAQEFVDSLPLRCVAKIQKWQLHLQAQGSNLPRPYADILRGAIRELRISFGRLEIRLLYFIEDKNIVFVSGFLKKTNAVPEKEIERAERRRLDWLERNS